MCFSFERSLSEKHGDIPERTFILWALMEATIIRSSNVEATITILTQVHSTSTTTMGTVTATTVSVYVLQYGIKLSDIFV